MNSSERKFLIGIVWFVFGVILGLFFVFLMLPLIGFILF